MNPIENRLCISVSDYEFSSYNSVVSNTQAIHKEIIDWFIDVETFVYIHTLYDYERVWS